MQRTKRSSSRITDGANSRHSDEDSKTAVKVGTSNVDGDTNATAN